MKTKQPHCLPPLVRKLKCSNFAPRRGSLNPLPCRHRIWPLHWTQSSPSLLAPLFQSQSLRWRCLWSTWPHQCPTASLRATCASFVRCKLIWAMVTLWFPLHTWSMSCMVSDVACRWRPHSTALSSCHSEPYVADSHILEPRWLRPRYALGGFLYCLVWFFACERVHFSLIRLRPRSASFS